ncbi:thioredoxin family protein [Portibacter lacus]|uniref:Thioredoxin family protein n=1 Tax=Portibacter lacus TaxID=1099794 RepID=A0AA37SPQ3_9BACT|nr:thioredoxin family protein [Portibacter lacus]GLR17882.1 thioredoxin family protein [Portibacter lacus]
MSYVESIMIDLGTKAPDFKLPDTVSGKELTYADVQGENGTVVMFICNHCPYVIHVNEELINLANDYKAKGIGFVAISSNDAINYPQDGPALMKKHAEEVGYNFPYLYDESQEVAKAYEAACTPDMYVFDHNQELYYRGRIDDARPNTDREITGIDIRNAMDDMLAGKAAPEKQYPSGGCNIKWK